ncbi:F15 [Felid gammaherpesvirus 1]|uniref:F15 n=1 Tax=Felid gammaherpesvirus 1 TaxID=2560468 RepID=A0A0M3T9C5_9GAMA|nr:F15 [Felis catus gammaherpesvirus 1]ALE14726.1 F15 [Felis catus gammaherpesvirus 1]
MMSVGRNLLLVALVIVLFFLCCGETYSSDSSDCCLRHSTRPIPFKVLQSYQHQLPTIGCHLNAIVFYTVKRRTICANPGDKWVRLAMKFIDKKNNSTMRYKF